MNNIIIVNKKEVRSKEETKAVTYTVSLPKYIKDAWQKFGDDMGYSGDTDFMRSIIIDTLKANERI